MDLYQVDSHQARDVSELAELLGNASHTIQARLKGLRKLGKTCSIPAHCVELHHIENQADVVHRTALARLFPENESRAIYVFKWKEIFEIPRARHGPLRGCGQHRRGRPHRGVLTMEAPLVARHRAPSGSPSPSTSSTASTTRRTPSPPSSRRGALPQVRRPVGRVLQLRGDVHLPAEGRRHDLQDRPDRCRTTRPSSTWFSPASSARSSGTCSRGGGGFPPLRRTH